MIKKTNKELLEELVESQKKQTALKERISKHKGEVLESKRHMKSLILQYESVIKEYRKMVEGYRKNIVKLFIVEMYSKFKEMRGKY